MGFQYNLCSFSRQEKENIQEQTTERLQGFALLGKDQEISSLLMEISELKKSMMKMENSSDLLLNNLRSEFEISFNRISSELEQSKNQLENERESHQKSLNDFKSYITILEENIKNCNSINTDLEKKLAEKQISFEEIANKHIQTEKELEDAKQTIDKLIYDHTSEKTAMRQRCSDEIEEITTAAELKLDLEARKMEDRLISIQKKVETQKTENENNFK